MSIRKATLQRVPQEIQKIFNIADGASATFYGEGDSSVGGGQIEIITRDDAVVLVDAVELGGTGIEIHWVRAA